MLPERPPASLVIQTGASSGHNAQPPFQPPGGKPRASRSAVIIIAALVVVAVVLIFVWYSRRTIKESVAPSSVTNANPVLNIEDIKKLNWPAPDTDADGEGLSDTEEAQLGTNPQNPDTDGDGLFDGEEVKVWQTDPKNTDTDGDGHKDGEEVRRGDNPSGPGRLVPQLIK